MFTQKLFTELQTPQHSPSAHYDFKLIFASYALLFLGLIMVESTSINMAHSKLHEPLYYFYRQAIYASIGIILGLITLKIPIRAWRYFSIFFLLMGIFLLIFTLIPGIGHEVNGSMRWINIFGLRFQPSESIKLFMILYLAGYLIRRSREVRESFSGFIKPMMIVLVITSLLLLEPDYGATVVLIATVLGMLFLAGVPLRQFALWIIVIVSILGLLISQAPYRMERLTTFMNPWADPYDTGFQLTQALIAIGRGELFGVGLGYSVQKLSYLPEAHTDFLFAVLAEELGLIGVITIVALFAFIIFRAFVIAMQAEHLNLHYSAYVSYGIGLNIALQVCINLGVNMGILPTKGLTLPLLSYGGSSMIISCIMLALLIRIDYETRLKKTKVSTNNRVD
jgi:cell division protein FtsW